NCIFLVLLNALTQTATGIIRLPPCLVQHHLADIPRMGSVAPTLSSPYHCADLSVFEPRHHDDGSSLSDQG
ncbi:hypothetical protein, partial [Aeromonas hydrophila]